MTSSSPQVEQRRRFRVIAIAMFASSLGLVAMSAWGFGSGNSVFGGVGAVAGAIEVMGGVYFWLRSNG